MKTSSSSSSSSRRKTSATVVPVPSPPPPSPLRPPPAGETVLTGADGGLVKFGWWALLAYLTCGLVLEALHAWKSGWYLDVGHETRRLMFTLGHAHGTLFALLTIVAGIGARVMPVWAPPAAALTALKAAVVVMPTSFLLAGFGVRGGDPGLAVWFVPVGAILLFYAVGRIAWQVHRQG